MKTVKKTSPATGAYFKCVELNDKSLVIDNVLDNTTFTAERVVSEDGQSYYLIPESALDYKPVRTVTDVAKSLGVTRMAIWRLIHNGTLQAALVNNVYVIKSESVNKYMKERSEHGNRENE